MIYIYIYDANVVSSFPPPLISLITQENILPNLWALPTPHVILTVELELKIFFLDLLKVWNWSLSTNQRYSSNTSNFPSWRDYAFRPCFLTSIHTFNCIHLSHEMSCDPTSCSQSPKRCAQSLHDERISPSTCHLTTSVH